MAKSYKKNANKPRTKKAKVSKKKVKAGMLGQSHKFEGLNFSKLGPLIHHSMVCTVRSLRNLDILSDEDLENFYRTLNFSEELKFLEAGIRNEIYSRPSLKYYQDPPEEGRHLYMVFRGRNGPVERPIVDGDLLHLVNKEGKLNPQYYQGTNRVLANQSLLNLFPGYELANN